MYTDLKALCVTLGTRIRDAVAKMDVSRIGIVLVVDSDGKLAGTITDGDVRRAVLANTNLEDVVDSLLDLKTSSRFSKPITAPADATPATLLQTLRTNLILHLPLVDQDQRVVGLVRLDEFVPKQEPQLEAVIMAGGSGTRLRPLTEEVPKSMLPVGDRPLMELTVERLRRAGIQRIHLTTHYKRDLISQHFGDGHEFGVDIRYLEEEHPLGTAGALSRLKDSDGPLLVINGDILTQVNYEAMLDFHREHGADLTMAVRKHEISVPYGVIETDGVKVTGILEKPVTRHLINAGIYLMEPEVCRFVPTDYPYDMPDLISLLLAQGRQVVSFPVREYWLDIGQHADYRQAQTDVVTEGFINP